MRDENEQKFKQREYLRAKNRLYYHRPWYIYLVASELSQPFSIEELRDAIHRKIDVYPQKNCLLRETHRFYEEHDIPLISRVEPGSDKFIVNEDIDLDIEIYRSIIRPPEEYLGRPRNKNPQS